MSPRGGSSHGRLATAALVAALLAAPGVLAAPPAASAPSTKPAPSPTVDEIVGRYVTARGGMKKLKALQTLRQQGRVNAGRAARGSFRARSSVPARSGSSSPSRASPASSPPTASVDGRSPRSKT